MRKLERKTDLGGKSDEVRGLDCWKIRNQGERNQRLFSTMRAFGLRSLVPGFTMTSLTREA